MYEYQRYLVWWPSITLHRLLDQESDFPPSLSKPQSYMFKEMRSCSLPSSHTSSFVLFFVHLILLSEAVLLRSRLMHFRSALSIDKSVDILDHIYSLPQPAQSSAFATIRAIESEAMTSQEPQPGLVELIEYLERRNVRMGLCTRNFE